MFGNGPRREEIIIIQYDDGVSCASRNAEIEGGRFSFVLLTKVAYRSSKRQRDTPGGVRGAVVDDQDFPIGVRLRQCGSDGVAKQLGGLEGRDYDCKPHRGATLTCDIAEGGFKRARGLTATANSCRKTLY